MFIAVLDTIARKLISLYILSTDDGLKKCGIYKMKLYSAVKKNEMFRYMDKIIYKISQMR